MTEHSDAFEALMRAYEEKVFSAFDRDTCSLQALRDFRVLLQKRLRADKPPPTVDEIDGLKILALDSLNHDRRRPEQPYGRLGRQGHQGNRACTQHPP